jgi:hypothetical protein
MNAPNVVIIGDTAHSFLYAARLHKNRYEGNIYILVEGSDHMSDSDVQKTNFVVRQHANMLNYLRSEKIYFQPSGNFGFFQGTQDTANFDGNITIDYRHGDGVIGDFLSSYIVPRVGPWFTNKNQKHLKSFIAKQTDSSCLSAAEMLVFERLRNMFAMSGVSDFIVNRPSILDKTATFVDNYNNNSYQWRNVFIRVYDQVMASGANLMTNISNLVFTPGNIAPYENVSFSSCQGDIMIENAAVVWKTNPYTFLRLATLGGLEPADIEVPVTYRAVVSIPENNGAAGVNLQGSGHLGDLVTSIVTFAMNEIRVSGGSCKPQWLVQAYTTLEDTSQVDGNVLYADPSGRRTLLIVEAISLLNRRATSFNPESMQNIVCMNKASSESFYLHQFAQILSRIYEAYTGAVVDPDTIISPQPLCQVGICSEVFRITSYVRRETSIYTVVDLINHLYHGGNGWPVAGKCQ